LVNIATNISPQSSTYRSAPLSIRNCLRMSMQLYAKISVLGTKLYAGVRGFGVKGA